MSWVVPYLSYWFRAGNEHSIHSPFVYRFYLDVIRSKEKFPEYAELKQLRRELRRSKEEIEILDLGAGSRLNKSNRRTIGSIARTAEKHPKFAELFFRITRHFQPETVFELGTSLGLTTLYFSRAMKKGRIYTFEGCPETARKAAQNLGKLNAENVEIITGNIDNTLGETLSRVKRPVDLVFFDANHQYEPTLRYFEECLPYTHNDTVFIFDDIRWSEGMSDAWEKIKADPRVTLTIDLFWLGLVFFRKEQVKENFLLRF